ncbi:hypothetical protein R2083_06810 [Nitrosomonas sp. Is35]|nr:MULTISPECIES: hypothetical protein [unclassified Nitrosomonas]MDV6341537.1 hypothetical protein [Nitrosomonas sp. Is24]MDV6347224.1 hypothetical protein [Nitrosomonas sp. Is35]
MLRCKSAAPGSAALSRRIQPTEELLAFKNDTQRLVSGAYGPSISD